MSYRVDIPTLSANEVYTLTFEYEGTETIQLIVGDLTLETTHRRVVFTTTSPVNHIESNVKLLNLNLYEGYYESDDFGGEYVQESYIEGRSLINPKLQSHYFVVDNANVSTTFTDDGYKYVKILNASSTSTYFGGKDKADYVSSLKENNVYTIIVRVRKNTFPSDVSVNFSMSHNNHIIKRNEYMLGASGDCLIPGGTTGVFKCVAYCFNYNILLADRYWGTQEGVYDNTNGAWITMRTDFTNCELEYAVEVLEGDYFDDELIDTYGHFEGIGCVKSPKIVSEPKNYNIVPLTTPTGQNGYTVSEDNTMLEIANTTRYATVGISFYPEKLGYPSGTKFAIEFDYEHVGTGTVANKDAPYLAVGWGTWGDGTSGVKYIEGVGHFKSWFTSTSLLSANRITELNFTSNPNWDGKNKRITITNLRVYKIDDVSEVGTYDNCKITTPDDLELYAINDSCKDVLDLATGVVTKNIGIAKNCSELISNHSYDSTNGYYTCRLRWNTLPNILAQGNNTLGMSNVFQYNWNGGANTMYSHGIDGAYYLKFGGCTTFEQCKQYCIDNNVLIYYQLATPITEQLNIKPLKSFKNGSITTSSQQLTPTLTTTLPISNKFTQTNLVSGTTYNIYFDGTATRLDCGGTIVNNPISPCEVECGGTTLTIEGEVSNVKVLETSVKNEVGSVNGTTDSELSRITTKCGIYNMFDDYTQGSHEQTWAKDYQCTSIREDTSIKIVGKNSLCYAGYSHFDANLPYGTYKLNYKVRVSKIGDKYRVILSSNPNGTPANEYISVSDITSTSLVEEQTYVFYKRKIRNMLFYTYYNGQEIEYYDISLIKLSDEDITGTDTSNINYSQVISDLEQPIKLRSLGTTYDSYNPVTSELVKRIGVSETDGSYSVLSSPIVSKVMKVEALTNLFPNIGENLSSLTGFSNYVTYDEDNWIYFAESTGYQSVNYSDMSSFEPNTDYTWIVEVKNNTMNDIIDLSMEYSTSVFGMSSKDGLEIPAGFNGTMVVKARSKSDFTNLTRAFIIQKWYTTRGTVDFRVTILKGDYTKTELPYYFTGTQNVVFPISQPDIPQLYKDGQVKVYSDSEVYPTTILNGQSTNNYEINELNTYNNYTIRYEGECESINLANKSNTQGNNTVIKAGATSGNLTFVNTSDDIDNVMLVQNDVREQEINRFTGLQTVEVSGMMIETSKNMWWNDWITPSQFDKNASGFADSPSFISVNGGENIYMVATENLYYSTVEFDENYNQINFTNMLIGNLQHSPVYENGYYKNYITLKSNTRYIKFVVPISKVNTQITTPIFTYSKEKLDEPILSSNTPYQSVCVDLPQPVQINSLPDGTCDTYNPITGEYVQNVGYEVLDETTQWNSYGFNHYYVSKNFGKGSFNVYSDDLPEKTGSQLWAGEEGWSIGAVFVVRINNVTNKDEFLEYMKNHPIKVVYKIDTITTQLEPIQIPVFEGGVLQLITTDGKVFPMVEYSLHTTNRYDTSTWETGVVYTQRNMTEAYFNESTTPMIPTETMTLTTDHISSGSIILNDNGNGLIVLKGNYTGRDIPYFTGMRSVEAIEVETTPSPDQPLFGKGGRK